MAMRADGNGAAPGRDGAALMGRTAGLALALGTGTVLAVGPWWRCGTVTNLWDALVVGYPRSSFFAALGANLSIILLASRHSPVWKATSRMCVVPLAVVTWLCYETLGRATDALPRWVQDHRAGLTWGLLSGVAMMCLFLGQAWPSPESDTTALALQSRRMALALAVAAWTASLLLPVCARVTWPLEVLVPGGTTLCGAYLCGTMAGRDATWVRAFAACIGLGVLMNRVEALLGLPLVALTIGLICRPPTRVAAGGGKDAGLVMGSTVGLVIGAAIGVLGLALYAFPWPCPK